jgi:hypothetical protein
LEHWSIIEDPSKIAVETLLSNGRYDQAADAFFHNIGKVKWFAFSEASHMPHFQERERFMELVGGLLSR